MFQSTHSRRVRPPPPLAPSRPFGFNPRTHEECDRSMSDCFSSLISFQSTHSRRVRLNRSMLLLSEKSFNPRTHEECDFGSGLYLARLVVSIHALTKSATYAIITRVTSGFGFQSTHSRRVRHACNRISKQRFVSIHALTKSATIYYTSYKLITKSFNPRTHEECDRVISVKRRTHPFVSIHALTKSATCRHRCFGC